MCKPIPGRRALLTAAGLLLALLTGCGPTEITIKKNPVAAGTARSSKVVFLAGPDSHLPGAHEHEDGSLLLADALRRRDPTIETVNVYGGWPEDESIFAGADALVMYCDGGESHLIMDQLATFNRLLAEGMGVVAIHYCVEVPRDSPAATALLDAIGGYFETWWSVNPTWTADFTAVPDHPVTTGVPPFTLKDEWYFNMRFVEENVTPLLSAIPPDSTMDRRDGPHSGNDAVRQQVADKLPQVTAWAYQRPGGGRGVGYTGGHYHANWDNENARSLVLNAIQWVSDSP